MISELAISDIEQIISEGGTISPKDIIRLNALGMEITGGNPITTLISTPRIAICGDVLLREPSIKQDIFIDKCRQIFSKDSATQVVLEAWILSHEDECDDSLLKHPVRFLWKVSRWVYKHLGHLTGNELNRVTYFLRFGSDPNTNEFPLLIVDRKARNELDNTIGTERSWALADYLEATSLGIDSVSALRATSPQLSLMIEREYIIHNQPLADEKQIATKNYYATLDAIRKKAFGDKSVSQNIDNEN